LLSLLSFIYYKSREREGTRERKRERESRDVNPLPFLFRVPSLLSLSLFLSLVALLSRYGTFIY